MLRISSVTTTLKIAFNDYFWIFFGSYTKNQASIYRLIEVFIVSGKILTGSDCISGFLWRYQIGDKDGKSSKRDFSIMARNIRSTCTFSDEDRCFHNKTAGNGSRCV